MALNIVYSLLYEDSNFFIVNKSSGVICHKSKYESLGLIEVVNKENKKYYLANRIDKYTSGIVILAKNKEALGAIQNLFFLNKVEKNYLSIVSKELPAKRIRILLSLGRNKSNKLLFSNKNAKNYKPAETKVCRLDGKLVSIFIKTGRTHQIRAHLSEIGCPILNDPIYSSDCFDKEFGQYLHAYKLSFICPLSGKFINVVAKPPQKFFDKLKELNILGWKEI